MFSKACVLFIRRNLFLDISEIVALWEGVTECTLSVNNLVI